MSQENVEVYKRAVDATNRRDLDALLVEFDPDVEWHSALVGMGTEVYRGKQGIREMFRDADENLRSQVVPRVKQAPGFVAGYWVRIEGGDKGRATIVFESEDNARAAAEQVKQAPGESVTLDSVDVGEVVEHA